MHKQLHAFIFLLLAIPFPGCFAEDPVHTDHPFMGEWVGQFIDAPGDYRFHIRECNARVVPLGDGTSRVDLKPTLDERAPSHFEVIATEDGGTLHFESAETKLTARQGTMTGAVRHKDEWVHFELKRQFRDSPTLGQSAPEGAIVLFDGSNFDAWQAVDERITGIPWKLVDGAMEVIPKQGREAPPTHLRTKELFSDVFLHIEFMTTFEPEKRGQGRGNSGIFLQSRYEVQVLDSFGLEGLWNECGSIYEIAAPRINMCFPPQQWQTYDLAFHGPRYDASGGKTRDAQITVFHNGKRIHHDARIPKPTIGKPAEESGAPGYIWMQDHGHHTRYRNIWLVDLAKGGAVPGYLADLD